MSCNGAEVLLCEPEGVTTTEDWAYVGAGQGNFDKVENYRYVGNGGSFDKEQVVMYSRWRMRLWVMMVCGIVNVALVGAAYWYFNVQLPGEFDQVSSQNIATSFAFDCDAGFWNWKRGWSEAKKRWCCAHKNKGCSGTSTPYDCEAGLSNWQNGWSAPKQVWCCQHANKGCGLPYDCNAGFSNWQKGWSESKKQWCCSNAKKGC